MPADISPSNVVILAHGVGGRRDLPIPFNSVLVGGGLAVAVSFAALLVLWPTPKLRGARAGRALPGWVTMAVDAPETRWLLRGLGLLLGGFTAVAALFGRVDDLNPTATFVFVVFWVGLVPASLLLGPIWRQLNPLRTVHLAISAVLRRDPVQGFAELPAGVGYYPAAVGLLAFTWLELAGPNRDDPRVLALWFGVYGVVHVGAATVFGSGWFDRCDAFEAYSTLIGHMAPIGRRADGQIVVRNPLDGLASLEAGPGLVAIVSVMLGSTAFDGASASPAWASRVQSGPLGVTWANTLGLVVVVAFVAASFSAVMYLSTRLAGTGDVPAGAAAGRFAHSLIPIAAGYVIAHYFSLLVFNGQQALILASDPLVDGANLFGTAGHVVDYRLISLSTISLVQVAGVVIGHVIGTVSAHDRATELFPKSLVRSQLPLLALMVGYTLGGLALLFSA
ncbi:hypothetical protein [Catenulispora rubra]|uniref:hypothetical protein n=1 Tax=Catenulispora rubra TaxID=280293 RepID=UPI0018928873|nr:hypothetical protein [Catenulispora rubra]